MRKSSSVFLRLWSIHRFGLRLCPGRRQVLRMRTGFLYRNFGWLLWIGWLGRQRRQCSSLQKFILDLRPSRGNAGLGFNRNLFCRGRPNKEIHLIVTTRFVVSNRLPSGLSVRLLLDRRRSGRLIGASGLRWSRLRQGLRFQTRGVLFR